MTKDKLKLLLLVSLKDEQKERIRNTNSRISIINTKEEDQLDSALKECHIIFGAPSRKQLALAEKLKWLHITSAGVGRYNSLLSEETILSNASGVFGRPIAEHILAFIFNLSRNFYCYHKNKEKKEWKLFTEMTDVFGSTAGILGLGDIGTETADRLKKLGCYVQAVRRNPQKGAPEFIDKLWGPENIDELLKSSDYVIITLPHTSETEGLINGEKLALMKKTAFLINVGRGKVVEETELIKALKKEEISGAGIDVFAEEPLPPDSPLWELPNVVITPHVSGFSPSNLRRQVDLFCRNLRAFINGTQMPNEVDRHLGY